MVTQAGVLSTTSLVEDVQPPVAVIPAYKPPAGLATMVRDILSAGFIHDVIIMNDGSGDGYDSVFDDLRQIEGVTLLSHMVNLGKGAALRTAFTFAGCTFRNTVGIVTADADGQHLVPDILSVARTLFLTRRALVLGVRQMAGDIPSEADSATPLHATSCAPSPAKS
jgi:glycosyltransferase involved in cell wall biosynthesis